MKLHPPETYQLEATKRYENIAAQLIAIFPFAKIEHIGSSAIPGALSKADLDICMIVDSAMLENVVQTLKHHAYIEKTGTLRTEELCMLECTLVGNDHAVQVVASGSEFERFFITFRNILRARPDLVADYNRIKVETAALGVEKYREAKSRFISLVLADI
ncbi:MAG: GrpB family protein [Burkholderiaceae bacterium]|nr:GrpB family protein [Burkholderiaceae bacterium]